MNFRTKTSLQYGIWNHQNSKIKLSFSDTSKLLEFHFFVSVFSRWSYFTLVFVSLVDFKVVKMCIRSTDHVSRLLKRLEIEWRCKLYTTLLYYSFLLGRGCLDFILCPEQRKSNGICLTLRTIYLLFLQVSLLFTFLTGIFQDLTAKIERKQS